MSIEVIAKPPLTQQQEEALEVQDASVALSAGAGCGKTRVLTERYLRFLEKPERRPIQSIVALTFTDKAARELRGRVRLACYDRLGNGDDPAYWRSILRALEAAPIGTFHAFCGEILRRFPIEAGIEPAFTVLDDAIAPTIRDEALNEALRSWLASRDEDLMALAIEFGLPGVRQAISDLIQGRGGSLGDDWSSWQPTELVEHWRGLWKTEVRPALLEEVAEAARPALLLFDRHECTHAVMRERIAVLQERLPSLPDEADPTSSLLQIREQARIQGGGTKRNWPSDEIYGEVRDALSGLRKVIDKVAESLAIDEAATLQAAEHGLRFARLTNRAVQHFWTHKQRRGALDYDDLLLTVRDLLRDESGAVLQTLREEIGVLLVDEFQDTDPVQAEILERLAGPELGHGRVFLVGDTKQSIYRFRGAQPHLFRAYRDRFPTNGRLALTENFRSAPGVITFVNALFADHFPGPEHDLIPRSNGFAAVEEPAVSFVWGFEENQADSRGRLPAAKAREIEARWLARFIAGRIQAGWPIWDDQEKQVRNARAGDVVFLLRTLNDAAPIENALAAEGLDYYVVGGSAFFAQQEVLDLINLLSAIEDPTDELALAGVLRGPFVGLSDEGLYWLAQHGRGNEAIEDGQGALADGLDRWETLHDLSDVDRQRAGRAQALLTRWRSWKDRLPIATLLDQALADSGFEAALIGSHLGTRKRANVRKLVRLARRFDAQGGASLADFVARLREDLRKPPREEQAATTDELGGQAVRLMSIHQSKGLEFPIVVVPDLNRDQKPPSGRVSLHPDLGPVIKLSGESEALVEDDPDEPEGSGQSLGWTCFQHLERREEDAEAIRLLYVATTRARESLILSAGMGPGDRPRSPALRLLESRFDLDNGECLATLPDGWPKPEVQVISEPPPPSGSPNRRQRPRLLPAARAIERGASLPTAVVKDTSPLFRKPAPRCLDLKSNLGLDPGLTRLDSLTRTLLADPGLFEAIDLDSLAPKAARAVVPSATPELIRRAVDRLSRWLTTPLGQELRRAETVHRGLDWRWAWPSTGSFKSVIRGSIDLALQDESGGWTLLAFSDARVPIDRERLRLLLSSRATGLSPIVRGWLIRFGIDGDSSLILEEAFDDATIDRAYHDLLEAGAKQAG